MDAVERLSAIEDPRRLMARYVYYADTIAGRTWRALTETDRSTFYTDHSR